MKKIGLICESLKNKKRKNKKRVIPGDQGPKILAATGSTLSRTMITEWFIMSTKTRHHPDSIWLNDDKQSDAKADQYRHKLHTA